MRRWSEEVYETLQGCFYHEDPGETRLGGALALQTTLDNLVNTMRVTFFNCSGAFNTIHPALLGEKLTAMQVVSPL